MKNLILLFSLILITGVVVGSSHAIGWESDLERAFAEAERLKKPIMADFYTDWCGWCDKLDYEVYTDPQVNSLSNNFICVKINADKQKEIARKYDVNSYPAILFFNPDGSQAHKVNGYRDAEYFIATMEKILNRSTRVTERQTAGTEEGGSPIEKIRFFWGEKASMIKEIIQKKVQELSQKPGSVTPTKRSQGVIQKIPKNAEQRGLTLSGIIFDPQDPSAYINGKRIRVGGTIGGAQVLQITPDRVVLSRDGEKFVLKLEE